MRCGAFVEDLGTEVAEPRESVPEFCGPGEFKMGSLSSRAASDYILQNREDSSSITNVLGL